MKIPHKVNKRDKKVNIENTLLDSKPLTPEMEKGLEILSKMRKLKQAVKKDTWYNPVSGLGEHLSPDMGGDRTSQNRVYWTRLPHIECERLYCGDKLCRKIVEKPVKSALRDKFKLVFPDLKNKEVAVANKAFKKYGQQVHNIYEKIERGAIWGRLYGSAYLLVNAEDGRHPSEPLDYANIKQIKWIKAFTPLELYVFEKTYTVDENYLEPHFYTFVSYGAEVVEKVHHSRVVRFIGNELSRHLYIANNYVHDSVLNNLYEQVGDYGMAVQSAGYAVSEFSQAVFKIKDLSSLLASNKQDQIIDRMSIMNRQRSLVRALVMDAEDEFSRLSGNFSGIGEPIEVLKNDLIARAEIPHNILFKEAAGQQGSVISSGAEGDSEMNDWSSEVSEYQRSRLYDPITKICELFFLDKSNPMTKGDLPNFEISFSSDRPLSIKEEAEVYAQISETDMAQVGQGLLSIEEVRNSRYSSQGTYSDFNLNFEVDPTKVPEKPKDKEVEESPKPEKEDKK